MKSLNQFYLYQNFSEYMYLTSIADNSLQLLRI